MNIKLIENYSDKACCLIGQTFEIKSELKELNGSFNPRLKFEGLTVAGWVFSKKRLEAIRQLVLKHSATQPVPIAPTPIVERDEKVIICTVPKVEPVKQVEKTNEPTAKDIRLFLAQYNRNDQHSYEYNCKSAGITTAYAVKLGYSLEVVSAFAQITAKNIKKEYHKPVFKDSPFKGRLTVKKGESINVIETTFKNCEALDKLMKQLSKEAEEQNLSISFKFEKID